MREKTLLRGCFIYEPLHRYLAIISKGIPKSEIQVKRTFIHYHWYEQGTWIININQQNINWIDVNLQNIVKIDLRKQIVLKQSTTKTKQLDFTINVQQIIK